MVLPFIVCPAILIVLGVLIRLGKAGFLIAGYNTLPKPEKEKIDEKALFGAFSTLLFVLAAILIFIGIVVSSGFMYSAWIAVFGFIALIVLIILAIIVWSGGKKFLKK